MQNLSRILVHFLLFSTVPVAVPTFGWQEDFYYPRDHLELLAYPYFRTLPSD